MLSAVLELVTGKRGRPPAADRPLEVDTTPVTTVSVRPSLTPAPNEEAWWKEVLAECSWLLPLEQAEFRLQQAEAQLRDLRDCDAPADEIAAMVRLVARARRDVYLPRFNLPKLLQLRQPGKIRNSKVPVYALWEPGARDDDTRECVFQTQQFALDGPKGNYKITSTPALLADLAGDLRDAITGNEQGSGRGVRLTATLRGKLPGYVADRLASLGVLEGEEAVSGAGTATEDPPGGATDLAEGSTVLLLGPAPEGFQGVKWDPGMALVEVERDRHGKLVNVVGCWLDLKETGRFDTMPR
jgi:hypothetical protein